MSIELNLDLLNIYAYADNSHSRERELWRGFLSYALPIITSIESDIIEKQLSSAVVYSLNELTVKTGLQGNQHEALRCVSALLAKKIGVDPELGLASFFDGKLPTKFYPFRKKFFAKKSKKSRFEDDLIISGWLKSLSKNQEDFDFNQLAANWRSWLIDREQSDQIFVRKSA